MKLQVAYEFPHTEWNVSLIYDVVAKKLEAEYTDIERINSSHLKAGNPCDFYSPHMMTIKNSETGNYIVVSYWDRAFELFYEGCGWNSLKCKAIYTSSGVDEASIKLSKKFNIPIVPISYPLYKSSYDVLATTSIPVEDKPNCELLFRGYLYGDRKKLAGVLPKQITDIKLEYDDYFKELQLNKINLSLNGAAEICHRDIEALGARSVLIRPTLKQRFKNELINGVHYIGFEYRFNPKEQAQVILKTFNQLKNNPAKMREISENGYKWFLKNGTAQKNAEIIISQLDISKIL